MTGVDSSVAESMYFLSEVALDALERLSIEEVNRIIESFAGYLNVISKLMIQISEKYLSMLFVNYHFSIKWVDSQKY